MLTRMWLETRVEGMARCLLESVMLASCATRGELRLESPIAVSWSLSIGTKPWMDPVELPVGTMERDLGVLLIDGPALRGGAELRKLLWTGTTALAVALQAEEAIALEEAATRGRVAHEIQERVAHTVSTMISDRLDETRSWIFALRQKLPRMGHSDRVHDLENIRLQLADLERLVQENLHSIRSVSAPLDDLPQVTGTRYDEHQEVS